MLTRAQLAAGEERLVDIDRVIDFILFLQPRVGMFPAETTLMDKIIALQIDGRDLGDFIVNEWVMVALLQTEYIEKMTAHYGRKQEVLTWLLKALLARTYDLELIRAVCLKLVRLLTRVALAGGGEAASRQSQLDIPSLINPLVEMVRSGNTFAKAYAMSALLAMSRSADGSSQLVKSDSNPVEVVISVVRQAKYTPLLQTAVEWLVTNFNAISVEMDPNPLEDTAFIKSLVLMLEPRLGTKERHPAAVIAEASRLIMLLMRIDRPRTFMISDLDVVRHLMRIVEDHQNYSQQLEIISGCLLVAFTRSARDDSMFALHTQGTGIVADQAHLYAVMLARTLSDVATTNKIRVVLNLLIVLRCIVRTHHAEIKAAEAGTRLNKAYTKDAERRFAIMKMLATTDVAFDRILTTVIQNSRAWEKDASQKTVEARERQSQMITDDSKLLKAVNEELTAALRYETEVKKNVSTLQDTVDWFKKYIQEAANGAAAWNYIKWRESSKLEARADESAKRQMTQNVDSASESGTLASLGTR